eukprot:1516665-Rhodomonas_salina.1
MPDMHRRRCRTWHSKRGGGRITGNRGAADRYRGERGCGGRTSPHVPARPGTTHTLPLSTSARINIRPVTVPACISIYAELYGRRIGGE